MRKTETKGRAEEMENPIAEIKGEATAKNPEEKAMIEILKTSKEILAILAEYAQKLHTHICLNVKSSRNIFQDNQEDQVPFLRMFARNSLGQCSVSVFIMS